MDLQDKTSTEREGTAPVLAPAEEAKVVVETSAKSVPVDKDAKLDGKKKKAKTKCSKKHAKSGQKKSSKRASGSSSESDSEGGADDAKDTSSSSSDSENEESELDLARKKRSTKKRQDPPKSKKKTRTKKDKRRAKSRQPSMSDSDSDSDSSKAADTADSEDEGNQRGKQDLAAQVQLLQLQVQQLQQVGQGAYQYGTSAFPGYAPPQSNTTFGLPMGTPPNQIFDARLRLNKRGRPPPSGHGLTNTRGLDFDFGQDPNASLERKQPKEKLRRQKATKLDFKRVDQVWDNQIHNYKLQDTAEGSVEAQYDEFLFHVRRTFDWEGKYKATVVDIKSKLLRECLQDVVGNIKGVSLVEETPKLDPNMLFLYLEDLRKHLKELKKTKPSSEDKHERKKEQKRIDSKRQHLKILVQYIDKDYAEIKKSLYPMLENGLITFDLLWALWKPNTLAFTTTYGSPDEPRVFKVEMAEKHFSIMRGEYYYVEGKYFEYDGKQFGFGSMSDEINDFRGARRITTLKCYPLKYHKNEEQLRKDLIERGKKFVSLGGVHYKSHQGMAYYKKKKSIVKVNINGRIMIDPSIHRRINPNYPISLVRPKEHDIISDDEDSDDDSGCGGCESDSDNRGERLLDDEDTVKYVTKLIQDEKGNVQQVRIPKMDDTAAKEKLDQVTSKDEDDEDATQAEKEVKKIPEFTDEEYLIASPVVLGFAFAEKMWLEFTVSGIKEIQWNETAYDSLVLKPEMKDIVKALVESHKYHAAESIDDVIQGKGKGLVAVLHGPPGTGKTLTAEGISELLKCPLYMVSAGELGTDSRYLESELQKILDICHAWGAILLLDEADVFLEKRNMHDIHRNALVSIFLRQLEYFQGILFLTTNRVETFDDAFQSRIHIALKYDNLDQRAKKTIFKIFIERVRVLKKMDLMPFTDEDYNMLARHELNGRQIKNTVGTAQALAANKGEPLAMRHIRQVLEVQISFERDLKGGPGYQDAMRSYY